MVAMATGRTAIKRLLDMLRWHSEPWQPSEIEIDMEIEREVARMKAEDRARELLRPHRVDQAAMEASRCYADDTCTFDIGCPFAVHCLATDDAQRRA